MPGTPTWCLAGSASWWPAPVRLRLVARRTPVVTSSLTPTGQRVRKEPHDFDLDDVPLSAPALPSVAAAVAALRDEALDR